MTTQEVADQLVKLCSAGEFQEAIKTLYSDDILSVETWAPEGRDREMKGLPAVLGKAQWFEANHEIHGMSVEGPLVAGSHFSVAFKMDATFKPENRRFNMDEIAIYKVADGKIVREEFFYGV